MCMHGQMRSANVGDWGYMMEVLGSGLCEVRYHTVQLAAPISWATTRAQTRGRHAGDAAAGSR